MATDGNGKVQSPNAVERKKRKRIKEKDEVSDIELASLGECSVAPLEISKLKKKTKSSVESENFGSESKALSKKAKGKNMFGSVRVWFDKISSTERLSALVMLPALPSSYFRCRSSTNL